MSYHPTVFNQLFNFIPRHVFERLVSSYRSDDRSRYFDSWSQFVTLLYAQITGKCSLRDIETGMLMEKSKLYHLGMKRPVCRSTLSDALSRRDAGFFEALFYHFLERVQKVAPGHGFSFKHKLYSLDASTIDLCLSVFDWAKFRTSKGAIRLHVGLDHRGHLPSFVVVSDGKKHELNVVKSQLKIEPDSIYCFDRGYIDYNWLHRIHQHKAFFVTRVKKNLQLYTTGQHRPARSKNILSDVIVRYITCDKSDLRYQEQLRKITLSDPDTGKIYVFLTNNMQLEAETIAAIYRERWKIELFFKWIKQNLKIKTFIGTSKNAVLSQIWVAMIYYLIIAYLRFQSKHCLKPIELARRLKTTLMKRINLIEVISLSKKSIQYATQKNNAEQMILNI